MPGKENILPMPRLAELLNTLRAEGKRIVLCHGVFDLLHIGHIRYLRSAAELGDILVVTVTPDVFVDKGPGRPAFNEQLRVEAIAALDCVDYAAINSWPTAKETLRLLRPDIYAKGSEFKCLEDATGKIAEEAAVAAEVGTRLEFIEDIVFSSSQLINRYIAGFTNDYQEYMEVFRQRYSQNDVFAHMDRFSSLTVMVVGDAIVDEYVYCSPLGASTKDPVLALLHQSNESFAGGGAAVANHVAQHAAKVIYCTIVGDDGQEDFIRGQLAPNVEMRAITRPKTPTVRKTRILDGYSYQKQLEIYHMDKTPVSNDLSAALGKLVTEPIRDVDMVLAADFGNGCISPLIVDIMCSKAPFLSVNTQANAGNRGYHTIGRYPRADFASLAGHEIMLEYRNYNLSTVAMMLDLRERLHAASLLVTEGKRGCALVDEHTLQRAPSFASNVVDRVGAGDALFAVAAMAACLRLPLDLTAFLGNIAGSLAVEMLGNAKAVSKNAMRRYITAVMK